MPKAVSRGKAKNGIVSYDVDTLANRFATLYPELKDDIRLNIATYGEFLPETFFMEKGNAKVLDIIKTALLLSKKSFSKTSAIFLRTAQTKFRILSLLQFSAK